MLDRKKATVKELQSLAGLLNFLNRAIVPGRAFTRRMYAKCSSSNNGLQTVLKLHHHIRLDREFKEDCRVWCKFLEQNHTVTCRPFLDLHGLEFADSLDFHTDAVKGKLLGFGAVYEDRWIFGQWEPGYIEKFDPSIEYLELFGVCAGVFTWSKYLRNR